MVLFVLLIPALGLLVSLGTSSLLTEGDEIHDNSEV